MHIKINADITLREIKNIFSAHYPNLKLAFYKTPHEIFEASDECNRYPCDIKLRELKDGPLEGIINIQPKEKIADLERDFQVRFGLPAQVLVKEHGLWTQTTGMDSFTLREANELSKNDSDEFLVEDYDEGFDEEME